MYTITSEGHNISAVSADLRGRLIRLNELHAGPIHERDAALTIRGNHGVGIAALVVWKENINSALTVTAGDEGPGLSSRNMSIARG